MKSIEFHGDSLDRLREFPPSARQEAGHQLDRVQRGLEPEDWKPMPSVGGGACEIRVADAAGTFRVIYVAKLQDAVHVLHCFQKKTQKTGRRHVELAQTRYRALMQRSKA